MRVALPIGENMNICRFYSLAFCVVLTALPVNAITKAPGKTMAPHTAKDRYAPLARESFRKSFTPDEESLLSLIRMGLSEKVGEDFNRETVAERIRKTSFRRAAGVAICLYRPGVPRITVLRRRESLADDIIAAVQAVKKHRRFGSFNLSERDKTRMQIDFLVGKALPVDYKRLSMEALDSRRFELGVDGLNVSASGKKLLLLPGDAFVRSLLGLDQMDRYIRKSLDITQETPVSASIFRTVSAISYRNGWLPLFRGYPMPEKLKAGDVRKATDAAERNILANQRANGTFLYYYDAAGDSMLDHEHPDRDPKKNGYYNYIRHSGAILFLLKTYERHRKPAALGRIRLALRNVLAKTRKYALPHGMEAEFLLDNNKGKLGGSGLLLFVLMEYQRITGDTSLMSHATRLMRHLEDQVLPSGEFRYYSMYLGEKIPDSENYRYFSFYYPGEAVTGMASYLNVAEPKGEERRRIVGRLQRALNFLLYLRPALYSDLFTTLPQDSWLMIGMERLWHEPEFRRNDIRKFVFDNADQMIGQMYTRNDELYPDYHGTFYYYYGDHPYPDAARAEGVVAAWQFAQTAGNRDKARKYHSALKEIVRGLYLLVNTPQSVYSARKPEKAIGGIRFKLTRQWFRIDTIGHAGDVFVQFFPAWNAGK